MATSDSTCSRAHTKVKLEKCSLVWVIDAFSHIGSKPLLSPAFSAEGGTLSFVANLQSTKLQINSDKDPKAYVRFYVTGTSKTPYLMPLLQCSYEVVFKSNGSCCITGSGIADSFQDWKCGQINVFQVGPDKGIEKEAINSCLINDVLEIHVRVTASLSVVTTASLPTPSVTAPSAITALFETRKFSDFVIKVQETDIPVHKSVLALKSSVFEAMLLHDTKEAQLGVLELKDTDLATARAMVEFFYLDAVSKLDVALAVDLLRVADKYDVVNLVRYCCSYLQDNLCSSNVIDILVTASDSNASELKELCFKYIAENKAFRLDDEQKKKLEPHKDLLMEFFCREP